MLAGPGTGKTHTLAERVAWLVEERGAKPSELTAVTFTNRAAGELRARLEGRLGKRAARAMTIGTFHAICLSRWGPCPGRPL
ncbi:MAG: UvrD-helicase domain-containing protein [Flavonifractor plautii]